LKTYPIQNRFTAGELSPRLHSRSDIEGYAAGCKTLENFVAMRHGSLERRNGSVIVSKHDGYRGRMFEFPITDTLAYAIGLTSEGNLYVDDRQGNLYGDNFGVNPDFTNDLTGWTDVSTGNGAVAWVAGRALLQTGDTGASDMAAIQQQAYVDDETADHVMHIEAESIIGSASLNIKVGMTAGGTELLDVTMDPGEEDLYFDLPTATGTRVAGADTRVTSDGDNRIVSGVPFFLTVEVDGNGESEEVGWWIDHISFHARGGAYTETELSHPYSIHDLEQLQMEMVPGENKAFFCSGQVIPYVLDYNDGAWTFAPIAFNGRPEAWNGYEDWDTDDGSKTPNIGAVVEILSGYGNGGTVANVYRYLGAETDLGTVDYSSGWTDLGVADLYAETIRYTTDDGTRFLAPGDVVELVEGYAGGGTAENVYQWTGTVNLSTENYATDTDWDDLGEKTVYDATPNFPGSVTFFEGRSWWAGFPVKQDRINGSASGNFYDLGLGVANDADGIEVTLDDHGLIQWIRGEQDLLIGTKNGEFIMIAEAGPITPSDINANKQSANGSAKMQGQPIGNSVAYTSLDGSKIRDMEYKFVVNGWQSMDISFTAEHLFADYGRVKEIHYAKDPESIIWFITDQGNLIGCTFDPANNVIGWHRHPTAGKVVSGCVVRNRGTAALWLMIDRHVGATKELYVERFTALSMMDSKIGLYYAAAQTAIDGFTHLSNQTVNVLVDGVQADDVTLDASGDGTASISGNLIEVGLAYTSTMETLPTDVPVPGGRGMVHMKRWNRLFARLYDSYVPTINDEQVTQATTPTTQDIDVINLNWDIEGSNSIQMAAPYPCRISGIFGELSEEVR